MAVFYVLHHITEQIVWKVTFRWGNVSNITRLGKATPHNINKKKRKVYTKIKVFDNKKNYVIMLPGCRKIFSNDFLNYLYKKHV